MYVIIFFVTRIASANNRHIKKISMLMKDEEIKARMQMSSSAFKSWKVDLCNRPQNKKYMIMSTHSTLYSVYNLYIH